MNLNLLLIGTIAALLAPVHFCSAESTIFTYQGRLNANGIPANGVYDFRFSIYRTETNGLMIAGPLTNMAVGVTNGLFTTSLDFGHQPFLGDNHWMDYAVRTNGSTSAFTTLAPRIRIASAPYAIAAANVIDGAVTASSLSPGPGANGQVLQMNNGVLTWANLGTGGTVKSVATGTGLLGGPITGSGTLSMDPTVVPALAGNQTFSGANNFNNGANSFAGSGSGLTSLNADNITTGTLADERLPASVARLNGSQTITGTVENASSLRIEGPGRNNWVTLSNGALWLPANTFPNEDGGDGVRGGIYFGSAGSTGPANNNNNYILNLVHRGDLGGQLLISHEGGIGLEEGTLGEIVLGNDGTAGGLVRIRYEDAFGINLHPGQPGHSHPLVFQGRNKEADNSIHQAYPSIVAFEGGGPDIFPPDVFGFYGACGAGVLAFYTKTPWSGYDSVLYGGREMGRMETNGWNLKGTMTYEMNTITASSGTNYVLDLGTNNFMEIFLSTSPVRFTTINPHGGSNNVQTATLIIHPGTSTRLVTFPPWKVVSESGNAILPTSLLALTTTVVRLEILRKGGDTNTLARFQSYKD